MATRSIYDRAGAAWRRIFRFRAIPLVGRAGPISATSTGDNPGRLPLQPKRRMTEVRRGCLLRRYRRGTASNSAPNYDGQSKSPVVLPGGFSETCSPTARRGIAVGMADLDPRRTTRPKLCDAALHLIDKPEAKSKDPLLKMGEGSGISRHGGNHTVDSKEEHRRSLYDRARLVPHPRQMEPGRGAAPRQPG